MATFTGQLISATYDAIIKTIDNDAIGSTAKQLTDGLGNVTPLYVSNTQIGIGITPTEALDVSGNIKASLSVIATTCTCISGAVCQNKSPKAVLPCSLVLVPITAHIAILLIVLHD